MTAAQWNSIYRREKERHGEDAAIKTLLAGVVREAHHYTNLNRANDLWKAVAEMNPELRVDGFRQWCISRDPDAATIIK